MRHFRDLPELYYPIILLYYAVIVIKVLLVPAAALILVLLLSTSLKISELLTQRTPNNPSYPITCTINNQLARFRLHEHFCNKDKTGRSSNTWTLGTLLVRPGCSLKQANAETTLKSSPLSTNESKTQSKQQEVEASYTDHLNKHPGFQGLFCSCTSLSHLISSVCIPAGNISLVSSYLGGNRGLSIRQGLHLGGFA